MALGLLDVLGYRKEIPICVGYEIDGEVTQAFPTTGKLEAARPVWEPSPAGNVTFPPSALITILPAAAKQYVERLQELIDVPVKWLSVGPSRDATIAL